MGCHSFVRVGLYRRSPDEFLYVRGMYSLEGYEANCDGEGQGERLRTHFAVLELADRWRREIAAAAEVADVDVATDMVLLGDPGSLSGFAFRDTRPRTGGGDDPPRPGSHGWIPQVPRWLAMAGGRTVDA